ncbi:zinc-binding dehydrogenase [Streptomyces sp. NPDC059970]|uniref:zinc-binding dehydrogenase n=1 Tax=Streptomyces sp. NPDC059970 TaxID=3347019 RepID=UPI0036799140
MLQGGQAGPRRVARIPSTPPGSRRPRLEQADAAHRQLEAGHMRGKIVLTHHSEA